MYRMAITAILLLTAAFGTLAISSAETTSPSLSEDGYSVSNPKFRHYRDHRGGERVLGLSISREFTLMGSKTQLFQRGAIQQHADWSIGWLDITGEDILPYTHFGGLTVPPIDPALVKAAPRPDDPDVTAKTLAFVQANSPDEWEGMRTLFYSTFAGTVTYRDAFPLADADQAQVPLVNLETWGIPISRPARDPRNHDFVYLRFQRGILHYDRSSGETKWLPVGEFLKALSHRAEPPHRPRAGGQREQTVSPIRQQQATGIGQIQPPPRYRSLRGLRGRRSGSPDTGAAHPHPHSSDRYPHPIHTGVRRRLWLRMVRGSDYQRPEYAVLQPGGVHLSGGRGARPLSLRHTEPHPVCH